MPMKVFIIIAIAFWALIRITSFLTGRSSQQMSGKRRQHRNDRDINVDYEPNADRQERKGRYKGGDYVDYKEVK